MLSNADREPPRAWPDASEGLTLDPDLGAEVDARALEYKLQIVRRYFRDYGSIPAFHSFKDLVHLRKSLTYLDPIDKSIRAKIDVDIRERMKTKLSEGTER